VKGNVRAKMNGINNITMADYSPEKAGVGGSIPSLATISTLLKSTFTVTSPIVLPDWKHRFANGRGSTGPEGEYAAASPGISSEEVG
jgi:hypothetical protein